jgi:hypothetical protein
VVDTGKGSDWFRERWEHSAPVRDEAEACGYESEQINELIEKALEEVRRQR